VKKLLLLAVVATLLVAILALPAAADVRHANEYSCAAGAYLHAAPITSGLDNGVSTCHVETAAPFDRVAPSASPPNNRSGPDL
jgi:hypothetical protein